MAFFKAFTGQAQANDINAGFNKATKDLRQGFDEQTQKYNQARGMYSPYIDQGGKANTMYGDILGLNGDQARQNAYNNITSDPFFQNKLNIDNNSAMRLLNARGNLGGAADLAAQRVLYENIDNRFNRYRDAGAQGLQATNYGADLTARQGDNAMGFGATNANLQMGKANALAANENTGINNVFGAIGALTGAGNLYNNYNYTNALMKKYGS